MNISPASLREAVENMNVKQKKGATESEKSDSYTLTLEGKWISQICIYLFI